MAPPHADSLFQQPASRATRRWSARGWLLPGFWNEIVGEQEILFIFKLADGTVRELTFSEATSSQIAQLCSSLNGDPIENTSDVPRYLARNPLYGELIAATHAGPPRWDLELEFPHREPSQHSAVVP